MVSINITPFIQNFESILLTQIEIVVYGIHYRIEKAIPLSRVDIDISHEDIDILFVCSITLNML